jgi:branched-chain amino acid transport system substrate-binding protein
MREGATRSAAWAIAGALGASAAILPSRLMPGDVMSAAAENSPITIGVVLPLTGDAAHWGIPVRNGADMAVEEVNRAGGIGGRRITLMVEDDRCQPADAIAAFHKIAAAGAAPVILGAVCSSATLAIAPLAEARQTVVISPASTSPKVTDAGEFIFRIIPSGSLRAKVLADYVYNDRGLSSLAALYINNEGGIGGASAFKAQFTQLGGAVVAEEAYPQGATDLRAQLAKIKASDADGVVVGSYPPDTVVVLKQARELGLRLPLFFTTESPQNTEVLRAAADAANGAIYILSAPPEGAAADKFARAYEARFSHKPELFAAEGYDVVRLIEAAMTAAAPSPNGPAIRDYLYAVKNYAGASGTITFDENGDVIKPYAIKTIEGGVAKTIVVK